MPRFFYMGASGVCGKRIATTSLRTGLAMTPLTRGAVQARAGDRKGRPYGSMQGMRRGGALPLPAGGEIGEAPPVADAASRFRGSAPIGGHDSGRESVGTTVGKRTPPLRRGCKRCGGENESPSHGFAVPAPFRQGGWGGRGYGLPRPVCELVSQ